MTCCFAHREYSGALAVTDGMLDWLWRVGYNLFMTRDLRKYAQQTNVRLVIGFLALLFLVGDGLIYWIYGREAAVLGLTCMLAGLAPVALIMLALWGLEWILKRSKRNE